MSAKIKYTNEPIEANVIQDFLPPPEELAFREEGVKVTIPLSKKSIEFFKSEATKHHTQYQRRSADSLIPMSMHTIKLCQHVHLVPPLVNAHPASL